MMRTTGNIISLLFVVAIAGECIRYADSKRCTRDEFDCTRWAKQGKCKTMKSWMEANCCKACKAVQFIKIPQDSICRFVESTCEFWAKQNFCTVGGFKGFMKENCCKTCQDYTTKPTEIPLPTEGSRCVDDKDFCGNWGKLGYCKGKYEDFMKKHCCKTCSHLRPKPTTIPLPTEGPLPTEKPGCSDDNEFCGEWAGKGWCKGKYKSFMKKHCCKSCADLVHTKPKPTEAPRRTTSAPEHTLPPSCKDDNKNCESWAKMGECKRNKDFMKLHCCKSCSKKHPCVDDRDLCGVWAKQGECTKNKDFMKLHCCKTCKGKQPPSSCSDDNKLCKSWAEMGECKKNPGFMLKHCRKSCNAC